MVTEFQLAVLDRLDTALAVGTIALGVVICLLAVIAVRSLVS